MYRKILVALENSQADASLLPHVTELAKRLGSALLLVHVADGWVARNFNQLKLAESEEMKEDRAYLEGVAAKLRAQGLSVTAQLALLALLTTAAAFAAVLGAGHAIDLASLLRGVGIRRAIPFLVWMLISVAVHVIIREKVTGHLTLITGWVLAVLLAGSGEIGSGGAVSAGAWGGAGALALGVIFARWRRGGMWKAAGIRGQANATAEMP